jgi:hypothetical protein
LFEFNSPHFYVDYRQSLHKLNPDGIPIDNTDKAIFSKTAGTPVYSVL